MEIYGFFAGLRFFCPMVKIFKGHFKFVDMDSEKIDAADVFA